MGTRMRGSGSAISSISGKFPLFSYLRTKRVGPTSSTSKHDISSHASAFFWVIFVVLRIRIRDPGTFEPLDPGWVKNQDPGSGSGSGTNIPDHISENSEIIFWVKILTFLYADVDPDPGLFFDAGIRDGKNPDSGSGENIPDPQHCILPA